MPAITVHPFVPIDSISPSPPLLDDMTLTAARKPLGGFSAKFISPLSPTVSPHSMMFALETILFICWKTHIFTLVFCSAGQLQPLSPCPPIAAMGFNKPGRNQVTHGRTLDSRILTMSMQFHLFIPRKVTGRVFVARAHFTRLSSRHSMLFSAATP